MTAFRYGVVGGAAAAVVVAVSWLVWEQNRGLKAVVGQADRRLVTSLECGTIETAPARCVNTDEGLTASPARTTERTHG